MRKRLQVQLAEAEYREIQAAARRQGLTVSEWVRRALREARQEHVAAIETKLLAITEASRHHFPTADIETMVQQSAPR